MHSCTAIFAGRLREPQQQLACLSATPGHTSVGHNSVPKIWLQGRLAPVKPAQQ